MDKQIKNIAEAFKGVFTEEELKKMEEGFNAWRNKTLEEKEKIVKDAYDKSMENQNPIDY